MNTSLGILAPILRNTVVSQHARRDGAMCQPELVGAIRNGALLTPEAISRNAATTFWAFLGVACARRSARRCVGDGRHVQLLAATSNGTNLLAFAESWQRSRGSVLQRFCKFPFGDIGSRLSLTGKRRTDTSRRCGST
jgi:hypothetical protein